MEQRKRSQRRRIYRYVASSVRGATCDEIEVALGLSHQSASARCRELKESGLIGVKINPRTGEVFKRRTRLGRLAGVLFVLKAMEREKKLALEANQLVARLGDLAMVAAMAGDAGTHERLRTLEGRALQRYERRYSKYKNLGGF